MPTHIQSVMRVLPGGGRDALLRCLSTRLLNYFEGFCSPLSRVVLLVASSRCHVSQLRRAKKRPSLGELFEQSLIAGEFRWRLEWDPSSEHHCHASARTWAIIELNGCEEIHGKTPLHHSHVTCTVSFTLRPQTVV